jgi:hypothetical protein
MASSGIEPATFRLTFWQVAGHGMAASFEIPSFINHDIMLCSVAK